MSNQSPLSAVDDRPAQDAQALFQVSRRKIMTNIAFMSGAALVTSVSQLNADQMDSRLIKLGRQLEPFYAEMLLLESRRRPNNARFEASGRSDAIWEALGDDSIEGRIEDLLNETDDLIQTILICPAESVIGIAVKARASAFSQQRLWHRAFDLLDWDEKLLRSLIEAALAAGGSPPATESFTVPSLITAA